MLERVNKHPKVPLYGVARFDKCRKDTSSPGKSKTLNKFGITSVFIGPWVRLETSRQKPRNARERFQMGGRAHTLALYINKKRAFLSSEIAWNDLL